MELFASDKQHVLDLSGSKGQNCCYKYSCPSFRIAYWNPRFSELGMVSNKVALERSRMVLCSPDQGAHGRKEYWRTDLEKLTLTPTQLPDDAIYVPLGRKTPIGKPGWGSMLSIVDGSLAPVSWGDLDPAMVESSDYTPDVLKDRLRPPKAMETTPGGDESAVSDSIAPNTPCHVHNPDVISECLLSELPSSIHSDDKGDHDAFFVQTCVEEVENAEYATPQKPLFSMRGEEPLGEGLDPRSRLREYVDSIRRAVAKRLCHARPTRSSWPLKQRSMRDISGLMEDLEHKITTWQREVHLVLMKSLWAAHVRTPEEDEPSVDCVYVKALECAYAAADHGGRWSRTYNMPTIG